MLLSALAATLYIEYIRSFQTSFIQVHTYIYTHLILMVLAIRDIQPILPGALVLSFFLQDFCKGFRHLVRIRRALVRRFKEDLRLGFAGLSFLRLHQHIALDLTLHSN